eukprot:11159838-Lingulodinium_polyedra.AAC.1
MFEEGTRGGRFLGCGSPDSTPSLPHGRLDPLFILEESPIGLQATDAGKASASKPLFAGGTDSS